MFIDVYNGFNTLAAFIFSDRTYTSYTYYVDKLNNTVCIRIGKNNDDVSIYRCFLNFENIDVRC